MKGTFLGLFVLLVLLGTPAAVQAQSGSGDGFDYTINSDDTNTITITGYTGTDTVLAIPTNINGLTVTSIGYFAFEDYGNLTSVIIPYSVTNLQTGAFSGCGLTNVTIPASVTSIGDFAFQSCYSLTNISVDEANPTYSSFNGVLFDKVQDTLIQYPEGLTNTTYTVPNTVTTIGEGALSGSFYLTYFTVPNTVTNMGESAFYYCTSLASVTLSTNLTSIAAQLFMECDSLTNVTIPNSVTSIGTRAFMFCNSLPSVSIPASVNSIGESAFDTCFSLNSVTIGSSFVNIGQWAFDNCPNLMSVYFLGNEPIERPWLSFELDPAVTVYYMPGTSGWGTSFFGAPTELWHLQATAPTTMGGQFGFNITGPANATIIVEACTNLNNPVWLPMSTNTLPDNCTWSFTDPQWTNHPNRYYRQLVLSF